MCALYRRPQGKRGRPTTLLSMSYNETPVCGECPGRCCTRRRWVFGWLQLEMGEADDPVFKDHLVMRPSEADPKRQIPTLSLDPRCPFLGKDNRCGIYDKRPKACREYICYLDTKILIRIKDYPTHGRLLRRWKVMPGQEYGLDKEQLDEE